MLRKLLSAAVMALMMMTLALSARAEEATLDLRNKTISDLDSVCAMIDAAGEIDVVDLTGARMSTDIRRQLVKKYPDIHFRWVLDVFGKKVSSEDTVLNLTGAYVNDRDKLCDYLDCLPNLEQVLMYHNFTTQAERERMFYGYPDIYFGWSYTMDNGRLTLRTDDTAFSTLKDTGAPYWDESNFTFLQFCTQLQALDLGHNQIKDISFLEHHPNMKVLILACNNIEDITPLAKLTELEYLELFTNQVTDLSPLANLKNLKDLNLKNNKFTDLSPLFDLPNLERLWLTMDPNVPQWQRDKLAELYPDTEIVYYATGATGAIWDENGAEIPGSGWRRHPRFQVIWKIFNEGLYLPWDADLSKYR